MLKMINKYFRELVIVLFVIAFIIIILSPEMGYSTANSWVARRMNGSVDTEIFQIMIRGWTVAYQIIGAMFGVLGMYVMYLSTKLKK